MFRKITPKPDSRCDSYRSNRKLYQRKKTKILQLTQMGNTKINDCKY